MNPLKLIGKLIKSYLSIVIGAILVFLALPVSGSGVGLTLGVLLLVAGIVLIFIGLGNIKYLPERFK